MISHPRELWMLLPAIPLLIPPVAVLYRARRRKPAPDYLAIARMERELGMDDRP